jgi:hypothetical protein
VPTDKNELKADSEEKMNSEQEYFLKKLAEIQSRETDVALIKLGESENEKLRSAFEDFGYEIIYRIMELLDGYYDSSKKYEVRNLLSNTVLNNDSDFHDLCGDFLMN